ncbi:hypothetical protein [Fimbriimonas ginsengisoli]|uniref:Uncharacterized protein n=1 Tax=Fimbriimonas ginsengisoli Gsoil 348 TaxID=661478 RepID=A0A068NU66_FIMGI|nr:hypothetical protein [Fimbriimonas ginsengisoli]AIE86986.1 hypothetical protein OP10G_3618 [Fimbriimonas ginsengisoli Gsoil 348]
MPGEGKPFKGLVAVPGFRTRIVRGLPVLVEAGTVTNLPPDSCEFEVVTGSTSLPDLTIGTTAATSTLLADSDVPAGMKVYISSIQVVASVAASGGTGGTVTLTLQDSAGTAIATYTQTALASGAFLPLPATTPASGVTDNLVKTLGPCGAAGKGIQAVLANSTAGTFRVRVVGYYAA